MHLTASLTEHERKVLRDRYRAAKAGYCMFFACADIKQRSDIMNDVRHWLIEDKLPIDRHGMVFQFANGGLLEIRVGHGGRGAKYYG